MMLNLDLLLSDAQQETEINKHGVRSKCAYSVILTLVPQLHKTVS